MPEVSPEVVELLGSIAACLTTGSFVPQAVLTFRTRDVSGVSVGMYVALNLGVFLWMVYGVLIGAFPVIAANAVTLVLALAILTMRLVYGGEKASRPDGEADG